MKTKVFFGMLLMAFFSVAVLTACSSDDDVKGTEITGHKEYTLTVASKKVLGIFTSYGLTGVSDVYAVKKENSTVWEAFGTIAKFDYEEGYEYVLRISETSYLDYDRGDPAWTEYELLEVISKEKKESENLPMHLIPKWYFEERCAYIDPNFDYAIDADKKEEIENDLKTDASYGFGGLRYYLDFDKGRWYLQDDDMETSDLGIMYRKPSDLKEFPEVYKLLPLEQQVVSFGQYIFARNNAPEDIVMQYDAFVYRGTETKSIALQPIGMLLYKDLTVYYKYKYLDANVKAVVIRYKVED